jgi:hypothetical protein
VLFRKTTATILLKILRLLLLRLPHHQLLKDIRENHPRNVIDTGVEVEKMMKKGLIERSLPRRRIIVVVVVDHEVAVEIERKRRSQGANLQMLITKERRVKDPETKEREGVGQDQGIGSLP